MRRFAWLVLIALTAQSLVFEAALHGQTAGGNDTRKKAFELFRQDRHLEALPLFEELARKSPDDRDVLLGLGVCLVAESATLEDQEAATRERLRARQLLLKAKKLGLQSALLENMLQTIPEDGVIRYSNSPADQAMRAAEAAFARHDFDDAIRNYSKVLEYDPKNYSAVLFIGDTYFTEKDVTHAAEWYQKAIELDPNRETAYRYYADMLLKNGDVAGSRKRFIESVVAEPYNPITWRGLKYWADNRKLQLNPVHIETPTKVSQSAEKSVTITLDPKAPDQATGVWLMYGMVKARWHTEDFKKHFPDEKEYRHSLAEEAEALTMAATVFLETSESKNKNQQASSLPTDPNLVLLLKLHKAKMIEPYVLLNAADQDVAQDYGPYREANRGKLEEFLSQFVVPPAP